VTDTRWIRDVATLRVGDHLCFLYETEEEHRVVLTPFLRRGLEQGEKVVYITETRAEETILGYLRDDGLEVEPYLARGQLTLRRADEVYLPDGCFDPERMIDLLRAETERALSEGCSALRATGEMTWVLRGAPGSERLVEYEGKLHKFLPGIQCLAMCQYDRRSCDAQMIMDMLSTHPLAVVGTRLHRNFCYIPTEEFLRDRARAAVCHWLKHLEDREQADAALRQAHDELSRRAERMEALSRRLLQVQEAERRFLANELLDEMGQVLAGLQYLLGGTEKLESAGDIDIRAERAQELARDLIRRMRRMAADLRPPLLDDFGLTPALTRLCERLRAEEGMQVDLQVSGLQGRLAEAVEIAVYRSIQEGLRNVVCHAGVTKATIRVWRDGDMLRIEVEDRGKGFDLTRVTRYTGLNAVRERMALVGGSLTVETAPGEGTRLMAAVPVQWAETGLATEIDAGSQDR